MNTKEQDKWGKYHNRFVAVLDIAGFKSFTKNNSKNPDTIYDLLYNIQRICERIESQARYNNETLFYTIAISDTVIIITKDDRSDLFLSFLHIVNEFFYRTFRYHRPMTGAIAYGDICVDREKVIIFGEAYQNAYLLQDSIDYYGVICDKSIDDYVLAHKENKEFYEACEMLLFQANSPMKCGNNQDQPRVPELRTNLRWHSIVHDILPYHGVFDNYYERSTCRFEELITQLASEVESDNSIDQQKKVATKERIIGRISRTRELVDIMDPFDPEIKANN